MIGGDDVIFQTPLGRVALSIALRVVHLHWPAAVVQDAEAEEAVSPSRFALAAAREVFVYENAAVAARWIADGYADELANRMVHLLRDDETLTVVVDDRHAPAARRILDDLDHALQVNALNLCFGVRCGQ